MLKKKDFASFLIKSEMCRLYIPYSHRNRFCDLPGPSVFSVAQAVVIENQCDSILDLFL